MVRRNFTFEEILEFSHFTFLDTSSLLSPDNKEPGDQINALNAAEVSANFFRRYLKSGKGFWITPRVGKEYHNWIMKLKSPTMMRLLETLRCSGRIMHVCGKVSNPYCALKRRYDEMGGKSFFSCSETDYNLFLEAAAESEIDPPVSIVSNDGHLSAMRYDLIISEIPVRDCDLRLFRRHDMRQFSEEKSPYRIPVTT